MAGGRTWILAIMVGVGALLPGCRLSRDKESLPSESPRPAPEVDLSSAPALLRPTFAPLLTAEAGYDAEPVVLAAIPEALQPSPEPEPVRAAPVAPEQPAPEPPQPSTPLFAEPGSVQADPPAPEQLAVVATGVGVSPEVLQASAEQACRALAAGKPVWDALDQSLSTLSCALRAAGRAPREALVMGSDGQHGAAGALPFDLDPAQVAAKVRNAVLGSVVAEGARAFAGVEASWDCSTPRADKPAARAVNEPGYVALLLRDAEGAITGGLVSAPERARPEGFLSASVTPGDYLYVSDTAAALMFGPDARLRAQGRARRLQARAQAGFTQPTIDDPLFADAQQAVWLDATRVGALDPRMARIEWRRDAVPAVCQAATP